MIGFDAVVLSLIVNLLETSIFDLSATLSSEDEFPTLDVDGLTKEADSSGTAKIYYTNLVLKKHKIT